MKQTDYMAIANGMVTLMKPLLEIVIHDLRTGKIVFKEGSLSKRKVGDPSLLEKGSDWEMEMNQEMYFKMGLDGRLIKSISIPLRENNAMGLLMCINCDVSIFENMKELSACFLKEKGQAQSICLFKNDYQERIHEFLHKVLREKGWKFGELALSQKREIVRLLFEEGAFNERKAAEYVAKILNMGRATIFNNLKKWRTKNEN